MKRGKRTAENQNLSFYGWERCALFKTSFLRRESIEKKRFMKFIHALWSSSESYGVYDEGCAKIYENCAEDCHQGAVPSLS